MDILCRAANGKGESYSKRFLVNIRAALNWHLTSLPFSCALNLMHDREFQGSNQVFYGNVRTLRQALLDRSRPGREGLCELTKNSFCEKVDSDGRTYVTLDFNELE